MKIQKLEPQDVYSKIDFVSISAMAGKIDELVDAVNKQQIQLNNHECRLLDLQNRVTALDDPSYHEDEDSDWYDDPKYREQPVDPYAWQHKWIGCICRFWFDDPNGTVLDYLGEIKRGQNGIEYYGKECGDWFPHCEPVKSTDNAIYKGGNNK